MSKTVWCALICVSAFGCTSDKLSQGEKGGSVAERRDGEGQSELLPVSLGVAEAEFHQQLQGVLGFLEGVEARQDDLEKLTRYLGHVRKITLLPYPRDEAMDDVLAEGGVRYRFQYDAVDRTISGFMALRGGEIVYGGPGSSARDIDSQKATAPQILEKVRRTYVGCTSYTDSGAVSYLDPDAGTATVHFTTAFERPSKFRFEFRLSDKTRNVTEVVWSNGEEVRTWSADESGAVKETSEPSLTSVISEAAGVSAGSIHKIPRLLGVVREGTGLTSIRNVQRIGDDTLDSIECFRIRGMLGWVSTTLWIEKSSSLIRRVDELHSLSDSSTPESSASVTTITTTYDPSINETLSEKMLRYAPPANGGL